MRVTQFDRLATFGFRHAHDFVSYVGETRVENTEVIGSMRVRRVAKQSERMTR